MKKLLTITLLGSALLAGSAFAQDTLRIGVDVPYEPMEYRTADGELTGFDIELGNALCAEIDRKCEWVVQAWDGIIPGLMARKYDAIMSSMTINEAREKTVLFSNPYFKPPSAWFAPSSSNIDFPAKQTLEGKTIGVQRGTLQDNYATDMFGDVADINRYTTADDLVLDMDAGRVDIAFLDFPVGKSTLLDSEEGNYKVVGSMITKPEKYFGEGFGIAFRKRDEELAKQFNEALATLKENGTYQKLYNKYFAEGSK
ncbi:amino acid ABC transporter substrate-binding protein (PAAT family) [Chromohalobacter marismortui]|uniref:Amino acid ABC transporter substrate-binding protein (PAAT family) n=1 Tax=Chromohalobacter marismortui TaxID=42055 RepID=A0A4R7NFP7_9GAMM|nr:MULTISPECIES: ABC transporter substrate-binding protein [Chromohalobacter]MCI0509450.1 ABC transporter substrate-binding protein [Chromohalobacter sp.]MCI0593071.1 ABC transporter substrate-binding protein [Chromohalobacter sp.]TDU19323.1 amino acid ABC transporter substrate-binding protein (PAAT family) [Chromohalobacter marismortui]